MPLQFSDHAKATLRRVSRALIDTPLVTERLTLRPLRVGDFDDFYAIVASPEVRRLSGMDDYSDRERAMAFFQESLPRDDRPVLAFAIADSATDRVMGLFELSYYPFLNDDNRLKDLEGISLSFMLADACQRRGIMSELLERALPYLLNEGGLDFVNCGYFAFNEGSKRLQEKLGMTPYITHYVERDGQQIETREMLRLRKGLTL